MEWKEKALSDFETWIGDLPDNPPGLSGMAPDTCDLFTLLSEFTALRQEIRMQNREQYRTLKVLDQAKTETGKTSALVESLSEKCAGTSEAMRESVAALGRIEDRVLRGLDETRALEVEKRAVLPFLDIRDALIRGREAAKDASASTGFFRRPPKSMAGVVEGYEMAVRRFDRALHAVGIQPMETVGWPFDSKCMRAVEQRKVPGTEQGIVVEQRLCGFLRGDDVIRAAEVVVTEWQEPG